MNKKIGFILALVLVSLLMLGTASAGFLDFLGGGNSNQTANDNSTFIVGFDAEFPPYGYMDDKGNYTGFDLDLANKEYWWLICDYEAHPSKKEIEDFLYNEDYVLIKTSDLLKMLEEDDFQWIWAVFSVIPIKHTEEEILNYDLPQLQLIYEGEYNPFIDEPRLQHPLAEFELYAEDSSSMFLISNDEELLSKFKKAYPKFTNNY